LARSKDKLLSADRIPDNAGADDCETAFRETSLRLTDRRRTPTAGLTVWAFEVVDETATSPGETKGEDFSNSYWKSERFWTWRFGRCWERITDEAHKMAKDEHNKAAEHHENAAKAHRSAAEHHGKGDHAKAKEHAGSAKQHSQTANQHSDQAHSKSQQQK
jgi:hypothetical protein